MITTFFIWMIGTVCTLFVLQLVIAAWEPLKALGLTLLTIGIFFFISLTVIRNWSLADETDTPEYLQIPQTLLDKHHSGQLSPQIVNKLEEAHRAGKIDLKIDQ